MQPRVGIIVSVFFLFIPNLPGNLRLTEAIHFIEDSKMKKEKKNPTLTELLVLGQTYMLFLKQDLKYELKRRQRIIVTL